MSDELILIGRIGSPWGIQGFNWIQLFTGEPKQAFNYRPWTLRRPHPVKKGQYLGEDWVLDRPKGKAQAKGWVCKLTPDADRNQAESFKGYEVWVPLNSLPDLDGDDFYHHQLTGCRVVNASGIDLGVVASVMETGANDVLVVAADATSVDDAERLIPWIDSALVSVDIAQRLIKVDWDEAF
ncbi:16S rRNA processing protein RimM [Litorivicinus lipolyticus]|uniref:Ribosome maturation factor RimM n=1 Tax=Litorivicinus lipolyticus TaxID=418701 RepID=A0A5Q2QFM7_9GAMM|nr:ribosome maturation factor RimM [Litorivicinus lipolyticus]QGG80787.1 16S rRNA processing protein RimM [Litorivicinus lipolyticus]